MTGVGRLVGQMTSSLVISRRLTELRLSCERQASGRKTLSGWLGGPHSDRLPTGRDLSPPRSDHLPPTLAPQPNMGKPRAPRETRARRVLAPRDDGRGSVEPNVE